jgi:hypothetical protein
VKPHCSLQMTNALKKSMASKCWYFPNIFEMGNNDVLGSVSEIQPRQVIS